MEAITITLIENHPEGWSGYTVSQGNRYADGLGYDEMLGLITALIMPINRPTLQWMKTAEEHKAWRDRLEQSSKDNSIHIEPVS